MHRPAAKLLILTLLALGFLVGGAQPGTARAKDPKLILARKHFESAETHYDQGEFKKALAEYQKALSYKRFAAFIFNIAQCHRQLKQWNLALFKYKLYLSRSPNAPNRAEVRRRITQMAKEVALQTAALKAQGKLTVITRPAGAQVLINKLKGAPDGVSPFIRKLKPGTYLVAIRHKGFGQVHRQVVITTGKMTLLEVTLPPLVTPRRVDARRTAGPGPARRLGPDGPARRQVPLARTLRPRPVHQSSPYYERWWFWTGLVLAATLAGGGIARGVRALQLSDEWKEAEGILENPVDHVERGKEARTQADIMFGTSAAVTIAVIIGAAIVGKDRRERATRPDHTLVLPSCSAQGCALTVTGRF